MNTSNSGRDDDPTDDVVFHELTAASPDLALLTHFYEELYLQEFPDPDERESLANMIHYLKLKAQGWYGHNNYHIVLLMHAGQPVGCSVSDYLATANAGVIEFLMVAPTVRRQGWGGRLLHWTETTLAVDADSRSAQNLHCIVAEMHDPRCAETQHAGLDPLTRARIWNAWGYRKLAFDYVQPALSAAQHPARHLMLLAKITNGESRGGALSAHRVRAILREYLYWAMRIETPEQVPEYREMQAQLDERAYVDLIPLDDYLRQSR
ncbi:MAG: GNAT family N-acetyltransferase [Gammaproteobacteria bacterium]